MRFLKSCAVFLMGFALLGVFSLTQTSEVEASGNSIWGYVYVGGTQVTPSNASSLTGRYPVQMRLTPVSGGASLYSYQYLNGSGNIYYWSNIPLNNYRLYIRVHNTWRKCHAFNYFYASGSKQINCYA